MTREEAAERIKMILKECTDGEDAVCYVTSDDADALNTAIKALEREPCEDAIRRKAVLNILNNADWALDDDRTVERYKELLTTCYIDLPSVTPAHKKDEWISCSDRLPKENEYVDNVGKYYLIQDEYGDMHVAHRTNTGWRLLDSLSVLYDNVVAWMPLLEKYKEESDETPTLMSEKQYCDNDREAVYEAYEKGKESALKESGKVNRYYSILRPVSLGTFPGRIHVTKIHNFEYKTRVEEIQYVAWGYFETPDKLTKQEGYEYDLVEGAKRENMG